MTWDVLPEAIRVILNNECLVGIYQLLDDAGYHPRPDDGQIIVTFNLKNFVIFMQDSDLCLGVDNDYGSPVGADMQILWIWPIASPNACDGLLTQLKDYKAGKPVYLSDRQ